MPVWTLPALVLLFASLAVLIALGASAVFSWAAPERRRLRAVASMAGSGSSRTLVVDTASLTELPNPRLERAAQFVRKSPEQMGRLRRRLASASIGHADAPVLFAIAELAVPAVLGALALAAVGFTFAGLLVAGLATIGGALAPGLWLDSRIRARRKAIENGLPDALDLLVVCLEAGSGLDQAILKTSEELALVHPPIAQEFTTVTTEVRAGQSRAEALRHFAERTKVDDVRTLAALLVQTDRFGTSVAQALRTHADASRTKRRQRAEERAAKIGVKLVFPLVLCLFPAFYVVTLGPAVIQFVRVLFTQVAAIR